MSSPSGPSNFEYTDDSVVARLSFDVPPQALTDVTQLTQALGAMATQQEYIARSTGSWLDYMQQIPQIMERASQSYREAITQMERMAYIQNEMGGGGGNVGPTATAGPQGGYSTAAPQGYINPFAGQMFGMGVTPDLQTVQQQMAGMSGQDPRLFANMMAARGQAINPALLGMVGGTVAGTTGQGGMGGTGGGQGWGNAAPGSQSPQATQTSRDSSAPPDPTQSGQSTKAEPQNIPATPSEDAPPWQQAVAGTINGAQQVMNEAKIGGGGGRGAGMLGMASAGMSAAGKWASNNPDAMGGMSGRLAGVAKGAGAVGLAAGAVAVAQNVGEEVQKYQQLGAVQGGDWSTGVGYEAQARMLALNPFITTEQARSAMQMALSQGFKGGDFDTIQDYMLSNFKDLGVQLSTSMSLARAGINAGQTTGEAAEGASGLLEAMYKLSRNGGASFTERQDQAVEGVNAFTAMGADPGAAQRAVLGLQEGYGDNMALRDTIGKIGQQSAASPLLMNMAINQAGLSGQYLPGAQVAGLAEHGIDPSKAMEMGAKQIAQYTSGMPNRLNRIAAFQELMGQQGVQLDWPQAEALYDKVTDDKAPSEQANENVARLAKPTDNMSWIPGVQGFKALAPLMNAKTWDDFKNVPGDTWDLLNGRDPASDEDKKVAADFASHGRAPVPPPENAAQAQATAPVRTEGNVSGNLTITVDQSGKVSAPQQIQLSGQQKSANAGYGSAQLNNAPPGDPTYGHAFQGWNGN